MSGFIRVKELPTRFEVRYLGCYSTFFDAKDATEERKHLKEVYPSKSVDLVTIRRWKVKRTNVVEQRYESYTSWHELLDYEPYTLTLVTPIEAIHRATGWQLCPRPTADPQPYAAREEAEQAARKWLHANGYRVKAGT